MTLSEMTRECLDGFGYTLLDGSTETDSRFYLYISNSDRFRAQLQVDEVSQVVELRAFATDSGYHPSKAAQVAELISRINEDVPFSLFYQQMGSGAVILKLAYDAR